MPAGVNGRTSLKREEIQLSIYKKALGSDFNKLHPQIQKRFNVNSRDHLAPVGEGVMERVWHGRAFTVPFLYFGTLRNIMFPEKGENIPFKIENYAYLDSFRRETVTWVRTFYFPNKVRRFDATMIYSEERGKIVDYLGTHQHLAVDIDVAVSENGGLRVRSGEQRFYEGLVGFRIPVIFSGVADVCEWYDDHEQTFRIDVQVTNKQFGPLFGYTGKFQVTYRQVLPEQIPKHVLPKRVEKRE